MFKRTDVTAALALCATLASGGIALAATEPTPSLTMDATVVHLDDATRAPLMGLLDKAGAAKELDSLGINIYGWVEGGYSANLRNNGEFTRGPGSSITTDPTHVSPFNQERGNHVELNQVDLRIERTVDLKKWDVGGMVEALFGTDSNYIKSNGIEYQTSGDNPGEVPQFEIPQAYVDVAIPVGNGIKVRVGKFVTLLGYETIAPTTNPFYSRSLLFNTVAFTQTGVLAYYSLNDQWSFVGGMTRGWDQATEDNNGAVDFLGQVGYTPNSKLSIMLNLSVGPQNVDDSAHYRTTVDPVVTYKLTDKLTLGGEGIYTYDGGLQGGNYGDIWGVALYGAYMINDMFTANLRGEAVHTYVTPSNENQFEITAGVTVVPMPKDAMGKNLKIRPEIRYDFAEDHIYAAGARAFRDQWTAAVDVIFTF